MRRLNVFVWLLVFGASLAVVLPSSAGEDDQRALPTSNKFGCTNCHNGSGVTPSHVPPQQGLLLNQFGTDWLAYGSEWSSEFARQNSDGDGCTNGYEMGDPGGTWRVGDARISISPPDQRNPGDASDCALPISPKNWGTLKSVFGT